MKVFIIAASFCIVGSCATTKYSTKIENLKNGIHLQDSSLVMRYANTITTNDLKTNLYGFTSEAFEGREAGSKGQKLAAEFLKNYYVNLNMKSPLGDTLYFQHIPADKLPENIGDTENVLAFIEGTEKPEEVLIISAHYDHLGVENELVYHGADDNGSGTSAVMEMAQAFKLAALAGHKPKRSILFLHVTAEEIGLQGSQYYTNNPVFELNKTLANLNIDMIGRVDNKHSNNKDYIYLIGADRISKELHYISEKVNNQYFDMELDYTYNDENDRNRYYDRSDHYNFAKHNIPVIFYFNGEHNDYHEPSDTPDKIDYDLLARRTKLIFVTAWHLAYNEEALLYNVDF
ncbi:M28 family peptidase [Hanstruepera flava]|uniref:M28 family peptidase n=1 Tax=Hanstruepera flava TaxID=2930218 RepID=UPI00202963FD|nr:M28 family peptidase [Hanstruepera flava]